MRYKSSLDWENTVHDDNKGDLIHDEVKWLHERSELFYEIDNN